MVDARSSSVGLSPEDLRHLEERGIAPEDARRQLRLLKDPPPPQRLERACTVGDGIRHLTPSDRGRLERAFQAAVAAGRVTKFVPASGAASRMFQSLLPYFDPPRQLSREALEGAAREGDAGAADALRFVENLQRFPFYDELRQAVRRLGASPAKGLDQGDLSLVLRVLLGPEALAYAELPKALIPFHHSPEGPRTALEEHLVEALAYARDEAGTCRLHFTVAAGEERRFEEHAAAAARRQSAVLGDQGVAPRFDIRFSLQHPATDTLALDEHGRPFRCEDGKLLLRPGGHGALLRNLQELGADLVFIKNIDNVVPDDRKGPTLAWKRLLGGYLVACQERIFEQLRRLEDGGGGNGVVVEAVDFLVQELYLPPERVPPRGSRRDFARQVLHRPVRVCGVVPNTGEPGGGPFWVRGADGIASRQIVEAAQISTSPDQQEILAAATHFNPVDLVCGVRDFQDRPFDLSRFVDPRTAFVSRKDHLGRPLLALERPGLWNGAMAHWHTLFVEVPSGTFAPVKTVFDLLRPEHQGS